MAPMLRTLGQAESALATAFFDPTNVERVNFGLREAIRRRTGYVIEPQRWEDLLVVMRATYVLNARHLECHVAQQLAELNELVIAQCMPMVARGIEQRVGYLRDASQMHTPLSYGESSSEKGLGAFANPLGFV
jgi:hypothetical protein